MVTRNYRHPQNELWMIDKATPVTNIFGCNGGEDEDCSDSGEPALKAKLALILSTSAFGVAVGSEAPFAAKWALEYVKQLRGELGDAHGISAGYAF
jgi:hypothetical protein